jgi:hypothetical protein
MVPRHKKSDSIGSHGYHSTVGRATTARALQSGRGHTRPAGARYNERRDTPHAVPSGLPDLEPRLLRHRFEERVLPIEDNAADAPLLPAVNLIDDVSDRKRIRTTLEHGSSKLDRFPLQLPCGLLCSSHTATSSVSRDDAQRAPARLSGKSEADCSSEESAADLCPHCGQAEGPIRRRAARHDARRRGFSEPRG